MKEPPKIKMVDEIFGGELPCGLHSYLKSLVHLKSTGQRQEGIFPRAPEGKIR